MKGTIVSLIVLLGINSVSCDLLHASLLQVQTQTKAGEECDWKCYLQRYPDLAGIDEAQAKEHYIAFGSKEGRDCTCQPEAPAPEVWIPHDIMEPYLEQVLKHSKWTKTLGDPGNLTATMAGSCTGDGYAPSQIEQGFVANVLEWTKDDESLCTHLDPGLANVWISENGAGAINSADLIWSQQCKKGRSPQVLEPLAGILRHPLPICDGFFPKMWYVEHLVLADQGSLTPSSKKIFFDAGSTRFLDTMEFFTSQYERRGILLDKIYVWEAEAQGTEAYWADVAPEVRRKWEPRVTFYDGIPVTDKQDSAHNPVKRILTECRPEDFCAFKLDINVPSVELGLAMQLVQVPGAAEALDELFYEHHVPDGTHWDNNFLLDGYNILTQLRKMGVRAHPWI